MQWFVDSPLLTLFFCIGVGSIFGRIRFGPVSFGPAGALFVALALSAIEPDVALPPIITSLSLGVFCYMVGIAGGTAFVAALRTGWQPVVVSVIAIVAPWPPRRSASDRCSTSTSARSPGPSRAPGPRPRPWARSSSSSPTAGRSHPSRPSGMRSPTRSRCY